MNRFLLKRFFKEAKSLLRLAFPMATSLAAAALIGVVDTLMIAPLGTDALAAVAITTAVLVIFYAFLYGLVSITGVFAARAYGAKDNPLLKTVVIAGLGLGFISGLVSTLLMLCAQLALPWLGQPQQILDSLSAYWLAMSLNLIPFALFYALKSVYDAINKAWLGVAFAFVSVVLNVPANYVLIYGVFDWHGLGLVGAGLASLWSGGISFVLLWLHWQRCLQNNQQPSQLTKILASVKQQCKSGLPLAIGYAGETGCFALAALMVGLFGASALAASHIVDSVATVLYMLPLGLSGAVSVRIGQAIGAQQPEKVAEIGLTAIVVTIAWMSVVTVLLMLLGESIATAIADDKQVIAIASSLFIIFAAMQIFDGIQATALGALRGVLDTQKPMLITLAAYWLVALPMAYIFSVTLLMEANGVWLGYTVGLIIAALWLCGRFLAKIRANPVWRQSQ